MYDNLQLSTPETRVTASAPIGYVRRLVDAVQRGPSAGDRAGTAVAAVILAELAISARLGRIKDVLQRADATTPGVGMLGVGGVSEAMGEFVENWKIHRGKLVSAVETHQKMAIESA